MANQSFRESYSPDIPPYFDGNKYKMWKRKMEVFISAKDLEQWDIIIEGYNSPRDTNGFEIDDSLYMSSEQAKIYSINNKAMNALTCALDIKFFNEISHCKSTKEIWDTLEFIYET